MDACYYNIMYKPKFKIGDRVKIIDASSIESCELNKIGIIKEIRFHDDDWDWDCEEDITYIVDMGRPRREREPENTCWYLRERHIELAVQPNEQLLFKFML